ncbi:hypothetical protein RvY_02194-2 [Ramazzottius varieornatus]|uniref:Uncharacterized protein n=1 Tax=Ramazzottius varieornatus TaxID=947166 RepID=A0A1D1UJP8_RAMVA|nr:hypothetical protein RvY_02194-2 [Ramazzottius varieornatus]
MMLSIPIFLPTFRREIVLTAGLVLWWAPIANSHRDAAFEYHLGSLSKSFLMATLPTDYDLFLYSPDHLTVLDQELRERRTSACKLNSSSLWFGGHRFHCQNSPPVNAVRINCGNLAETETTVQLDVGTSPLLSSRLHARDPPPWSTNVSKDTRMSCMQRVLQFENMELDLPAGSRYLYGYKADNRSLFAVILKNKEVERNEDHDQFITELHVYGLQKTKWSLQGSRVLKCVKTEDNWLDDFEQATAAIAIRQHSSEQFPGTSANVLYVAFHMQANMRDDSSLCRFVLDDFKGWRDQLNEVRFSTSVKSSVELGSSWSWASSISSYGCKIITFQTDRI